MTSWWIFGVEKTLVSVWHAVWKIILTVWLHVKVLLWTYGNKIYLHLSVNETWVIICKVESRWFVNAVNSICSVFENLLCLLHYRLFQGMWTSYNFNEATFSLFSTPSEILCEFGLLDYTKLYWIRNLVDNFINFSFKMSLCLLLRGPPALCWESFCFIRQKSPSEPGSVEAAWKSFLVQELVTCLGKGILTPFQMETRILTWSKFIESCPSSMITSYCIR